MTERVLPHSDEAEQALLGAILASNKVHDRVADILKPQHFASRLHVRIYDAILRLIERGTVADPITIKQAMGDDQDFVAVGGFGYLMRLAASVTSIVNAVDYAHAIVDLSYRRRLIAEAQDIAEAAYDDRAQVDGRAQVEIAETRLSALVDGDPSAIRIRCGEDVGRSYIDQVNRAAKFDPDQVSGIPTGLADIDRMLGGFARGDFIVIGARPSMGKTAFGTQIAYGAAGWRCFDDPSRSHVAAILSMEMSAEQLRARQVGALTGIPSKRQMQAGLSDDDIDAIIAANREIDALPVWIDESPDATVPALRSRMRRLKRRGGLDLVVVDYLQLMRGSGASGENRVQELSGITRGLKGIARELECVVIAISQLSRALEAREDKRPQMQDLRDSGSIEQDADTVIFLFREEYYLDREQPRRKPNEKEGTFAGRQADWQDHRNGVAGLAEVIVAKQRQAAIGTATVRFDASRTLFRDRFDMVPML